MDPSRRSACSHVGPDALCDGKPLEKLSRALQLFEFRGNNNVVPLNISSVGFLVPLSTANMDLISYIVIFFSFLSAVASTQCYSQTGSPTGSIVCNSTANTGACCNIDNGDICTTSGLCLRQDSIPGFLYQDDCTDSNWGSTCPDFCPGKICRFLLSASSIWEPVLRMEVPEYFGALGEDWLELRS